MYCRYCGSRIEENDKFCVVCGSSLESTPSKEELLPKPKPIPSPAPAPGPSPSPEQRPSIFANMSDEKKKLFIISGCALLGIFIVVMIIVLIAGGGFGSAESVCEKYTKSVLSESGSGVLECVPKEFLESTVKEYHVSESKIADRIYRRNHNIRKTDYIQDAQYYWNVEDVEELVSDFTTRFPSDEYEQRLRKILYNNYDLDVTDEILLVSFDVDTSFIEVGDEQFKVPKVIQSVTGTATYFGDNEKSYCVAFEYNGSWYSLDAMRLVRRAANNFKEDE